MKILGNRPIATKLLYSGSVHDKWYKSGWTYEAFHSRCDGKGPTLTLFQIKDGDCIGGFTEAQWDSAEDG